MLTKSQPEESRSYYDVEKYRRILKETLRARKGFWKVLGRITGALDSIQGFFIAFLAFGIVYGTILAVIVGVYFGPFVFVGIWAGIIGGLGFLAERRVGGSLRFGDYSVWKKTLGTSLAFLLALGLILFILNFRSFHLPW